LERGSRDWGNKKGANKMRKKKGRATDGLSVLGRGDSPGISGLQKQMTKKGQKTSDPLQREEGAREAGKKREKKKKNSQGLYGKGEGGNVECEHL